MCLQAYACVLFVYFFILLHCDENKRMTKENDEQTNKTRCKTLRFEIKLADRKLMDTKIHLLNKTQNETTSQLDEIH